MKDEEMKKQNLCSRNTQILSMSNLLTNYAHFHVTQTNNFPKHLTKTLRVTNKTKKVETKV